VETNQRNRAATTQRIVDALEQILSADGLEGVGVGTIAEKANVSKVLIYRYFGGIEGLLEYYVRLGRLVPHFTPALQEQIQPVHPQDLATVWSTQTLKLFRKFRASRPARQCIKATVKENDPRAETISKNLDSEFTRLVQQLAFVKGGDHLATSAVILGALSYLTIQAQNNRTMIGIDLRSEEGWQRVEDAVKLIYKALNKLTMESSTNQILLKSTSVVVDKW
jgi:AcrR family transcriptional regulator